MSENKSFSYWYDEYRQISLVKDAFFLKDGELFEMYQKVVKSSNSKRNLIWFYYIKKDDKFLRIYERDRHNYRYTTLREAKELFPERFI